MEHGVKNRKKYAENREKWKKYSKSGRFFTELHGKFEYTPKDMRKIVNNFEKFWTI